MTRFHQPTIVLPKEDLVKRSVRAQRIATYISNLDPEKSWEVIVRPRKATRSVNQNDYLWAIYDYILRAGGETMGGWTKDDLHEFFLITHFGSETKELFGRKRLKPLRRSSKLNKQEFSDFLETIFRFMAERGVYIPSPEDDWREVA